MTNGEMWDRLFETVNSFRAELKPTQAVSENAFTLAVFALLLSFSSEALNHPQHARKLKDTIVKGLREAGLSNRMVQVLSELLTGVCDNAEKLQ